MTPNPLVLLIAAVVPFIFAMIWFSPKLFGGDNWNSIANLTAEQTSEKVKPWKAFATILFNFFLAFGLFGVCVHQMGVFSLVGGNAELLTTGVGAEFMAAYGDRHLSFGHGAFHGVIAAFCFMLPTLMYATIFERKSGKYFAVNFIYWIISMALMGGIVGQWGAVSL